MEPARNGILTVAALLVLASCTSPGEQGPAGGPAARAEQGRQVALEVGCTACHTADGNPSVGPSWKGLWGKQETLNDGRQVVVDETYVRESIATPDAKVVQGFAAGIMPKDFGQKLTAQQISALIEYIKSLK